MRLIFAGTPTFAAAALQALVDVGHDIVLVLTQPDRPAGRGMKLTPSPVKELAQAQSLRVFQPATLKTEESHTTLRSADAEVMVVAAYGLILPQAVLDIPRRGCLNIHASLLPRWRGAAPIQRAILAGDEETGITIMQMDAGLDTGAMLLKKPLPIGPDDTAGSLHDRLARLGADAIVEALARLDQLIPEAQDDAQATYAAKLTKDEARLDWSRPAEQVARAVRGYNPVPGAHALLDGKVVKIWQATPLPGKTAAAQPGEIVAIDASGPIVACGDGRLRIEELQLAGGKRMNAAAFMAGRSLPAGSRFG